MTAEDKLVYGLLDASWEWLRQRREDRELSEQQELMVRQACRFVGEAKLRMELAFEEDQ